MEADAKAAEWDGPDAADPAPRRHEVLVDIVAAPVGASDPVVPLSLGVGAIARVSALGASVTHVTLGDWVYCDPTVGTGDDAAAPALAEQMIVPTANTVRVGEIEAAEAGRWCALSTLLVPYGGLLAAAFQPGETVLVNDATGHLGSAAVAVALAMGARRVVATGRDENVLDDLERRFETRVRCVRLTGYEDEDRAQIVATAGVVDCAIDIPAPAANVAMSRTAALSVRPHGRIVLMGGAEQDLPIPYRHLTRNNVTIRGQGMHPPEAPARMIGLIRAGLVDLRQFRVDAFPLSQAGRAIAHAARTAGAFRLTVLRPE
jgi:alcohol dehydrogenase